MKKAWLVLVTMVLIAAACKLPAPEIDSPTATDPSVLFTSAAETADALRLGKGDQVPSLPPDVLIKTSLAPTRTPTPVGTRLTPTNSPHPTNTPIATIEPAPESERAEFVADVNVPDGTTVQPGGKFVKTWRLRNAGEKTWTSAYRVIFMEGDLLGAPADFPMPQKVLPGEEVDISLELVAPTAPGFFRGDWKIMDSSGKIFGVGEDGEEPFWFDIIVAGSQDEQAAQNTVDGETIIRSLSLSVDQAEVVSADCPHTFVLTADFSVNEPGPLTYQLEAHTPNFAFELKLPPPQTRTLKAGDHQIVYELEFDNQIKGWVRFIIIEPETVKSPPVNFSLECQ